MMWNFTPFLQPEATSSLQDRPSTPPPVSSNVSEGSSPNTGNSIDAGSTPPTKHLETPSPSYSPKSSASSIIILSRDETFSPHSPTFSPPALYRSFSPITPQHCSTLLWQEEESSPDPIPIILSCNPASFNLPVRRALFPEWQADSVLIEQSIGWNQFSGDASGDNDCFDASLAAIPELVDQEDYMLARPILAEITEDVRRRLRKRQSGIKSRNAAITPEPRAKRNRQCS